MTRAMYLILLLVLSVGPSFAVILPAPSSSDPAISGTHTPASAAPDCRIQTC
jgi:hypothetical protein